MAVNLSPFGLQSATGMKFTLGLDIGRVCRFFGFKVAKIDFLAVDLDSCPPWQDSAGIRSYAQDARGFIGGGRFSSILSVFFSRNFSEVSPSVVRAISAYVIALFRWEAPDHVEKSKPVRDIKSFEYSDAHIPIRVYASGNIAGCTLTGRNFPCEYSGFFGIVKNFAQTLCGNINVNHDAVLSLNGQKPRGAENAVAASFIVGV